MTAAPEPTLAREGVRRILIVDDSVVVRQMLARILSAEPDLEVIGTAAGGKQALALSRIVKPEVVVLDFEMPGMNGLEVLVALRELDPSIVVLMFSSLTVDGAALTIQALEAGAADYVTKPVGFSDPEQAQSHVRDQLIPRIRALAPLARISWPEPPPSRRAERPPTPRVVAIAASTGGPAALFRLISQLPASFPVPIVIVQHMPVLFTAQLANRLNSLSSLDVREAENGLVLSAGRVIVARGGRHLEITGDAAEPVARLTDTPPEHSCRPAADTTFRSAVACFGGGVLGIVLTGMGHDGRAGATAIRDAGGSVLAQDEASSVVWGMPGSVVNAGQADEVLDVSGLRSAMIERTALASSWRTPA